MVRNLGKLMQVVALLVLPASMIMELTAELRSSNLSVMLMLLVFGIALFCVGRMVEGFGMQKP